MQLNTNLEFYDAVSNTIINSVAKNPYGVFPSLSSQVSQKNASGLQLSVFKPEKSKPQRLREVNVTITADGIIKKEPLGLFSGANQEVNLHELIIPRKISAPNRDVSPCTPPSHDGNDSSIDGDINAEEIVDYPRFLSDMSNRKKSSKKGRKSRKKRSKSSKGKHDAEKSPTVPNDTEQEDNFGFADILEANCSRVRLNTPHIKPIKLNVDYTSYIKNVVPRAILGTNSNNLAGGKDSFNSKSSSVKHTIACKPKPARKKPVTLATPPRKPQLGVDRKPDGVHNNSKPGSHYSVSRQLSKSCELGSLGMPSTSQAAYGKTVTKVPARDPSPTKVVKKYLSEKQSKDIEEMGKMIPAVPPTSPSPGCSDEEKVECVDSLTDNKAQRSIRAKLAVVQEQRKKLSQQAQTENRKKLEQKEKDLTVQKKREQRRKIYALNAIMTKFERGNFINFCRENGIYCNETLEP